MVPNPPRCVLRPDDPKQHTVGQLGKRVVHRKLHRLDRSRVGECDARVLGKERQGLLLTFGEPAAGVVMASHDDGADIGAGIMDRGGHQDHAERRGVLGDAGRASHQVSR